LVTVLSALLSGKESLKARDLTTDGADACGVFELTGSFLQEQVHGFLLVLLDLRFELFDGKFAEFLGLGHG
jgi:hypothetical protein